MKKNALGALLLCAGMTLAGCSSSADKSSSAAVSSSVAVSVESSASANAADDSAPVMSYQEYADAELDSEVVIEAYVQAKQSWWEDKATIYAEDEDGAYFIYNANVSEDLYNQLEDGTKIRVKGYKTEWSGEVEVAEGAEVEIVEGEKWVATPVDVTDLLGNEEELIKHQNQLVDFKGLTVEAAEEGSDAAYLYNYDGSGTQGDDLYFNVSKDGNTYTFVVESYLTGADTDVYKAVEALKVGDVIDCEGFLYWYEGANPHIISVTVTQNAE